MKGKTTLWLACALGVLAVLMALGGSETVDTQTRAEKRIAEVLSAITGAGEVEVALFYAQENKEMLGASQSISGPTGAVVVAQGAADLQVRLQLIRAVRTLLGLPENAVDVFVMEEGRR